MTSPPWVHPITWCCVAINHCFMKGAEEDFVTAIERKADLGAPTRNLAKANVDSTAQAVAIVSN